MPFPPFPKTNKQKTCPIRSIFILKVVLCDSSSSVFRSSFWSVDVLGFRSNAQRDEPTAEVTMHSPHVLLLIMAIPNHVGFNICKESTYMSFPLWLFLEAHAGLVTLSWPEVGGFCKNPLSNLFIFWGSVPYKAMQSFFVEFLCKTNHLTYRKRENSCQSFIKCS